jgi:protein-tyrosine kinase
VQPPNPAEMIGSARMRDAIQEFTSRFDMVIFDTAPVLVATESSILAARTDAVVLVVRAGRTDRAAASLAIEQLRKVGATVLGCVLNDSEGNVPKYNRYDYYYSYYYGNDDDEAEAEAEVAASGGAKRG